PFFAGLLMMAGGIWSLVLIYLGLPVMMRTPPARAFGYTVLVIVAAFICQILVSLLMAGVTPKQLAGLGPGGPGTGSTVTIQTPGGTVSTSTDKIDAMTRKMEAAAREAERASREQDPQGMAKAAADT